MLPDSNNHPTSLLEERIGLAVPAAVAFDLFDPEVDVCPRSLEMHLASMPKAAVEMLATVESTASRDG